MTNAMGVIALPGVAYDCQEYRNFHFLKPYLSEKP